MVNVKAWVSEFKPMIIIMEQLPFLVATAISLKFFPATFDWFYWGMIFVAMIVFEMGAILMNDYFDFKSGNDIVNKAKSPFSGGSDLLVNKVIDPKKFLIMALLFFAFTTIVGLFIVATRSPFVLILGVIGVGIGIFYTAPPFKFAYRGLGEITTTLATPMIIFGVVLTMGNVTTIEQITGNMNMWIMTAFIAFIVMFINAALHMYVEFPDYEADKETNKNNLIVRLGIKKAALLFLGISLLAYIGLIAGIIFGILPVQSIIALFAFPITMSAFGGLMEHGNEPRVIPMFLKDAGNAYVIMCAVLFASVL